MPRMLQVGPVIFPNLKISVTDKHPGATLRTPTVKEDRERGDGSHLLVTENRTERASLQEYKSAKELAGRLRKSVERRCRRTPWGKVVKPDDFDEVKDEYDVAAELALGFNADSEHYVVNVSWMPAETNGAPADDGRISEAVLEMIGHLESAIAGADPVRIRAVVRTELSEVKTLLPKGSDHDKALGKLLKRARKTMRDFEAAAEESQAAVAQVLIDFDDAPAVAARAIFQVTDEPGEIDPELGRAAYLPAVPPPVDDVELWFDDDEGATP